jgi:guanylate kinase
MLIVISGPTGAGKDKVIKALLEKRQDIYMPTSNTTKPIKQEESNEKKYKYLTNKEFFKVVDNKGFLEWAEVYGNYYGTPKHKVNKALQEGKIVLLELDIKGALQVKENYEDSILIFILPQSIQELKDNTLNSDKDTADNLLRKFYSAYSAINSISTYNYGVINSDVDQAVNQIETIIAAEECRVERIEKIL